MTTTVSRVLAGLDGSVPGDKAASWDVHGLQLGDPGAPVRRTAVCHEVTEEVVAAVEADPVDLLVTYHPLLFRETRALVAGRTPEGRALRLIRAGVSLGVAHTAFDAAPGGTADALADALGLGDVRGFAPLVGPGAVKIAVFLPAGAVEEVAAAMAGAGGGVIGSYTGCSFRTEGTGAFTAPIDAAPAAGERGSANRERETRLEMIVPAGRRDVVIAALVASHPYEEPAFDVYDVVANTGFVGRVGTSPDGTLAGLVERVASRLGRAGLRTAGGPDRPVARVAVVPGSGGSFVSAARSAGADVLVTGDVDHHRMVAALDRDLAVVDAGHAPTERPGMASLVDAVTAVTPETVDLTGIDPTPWR